MGLVLRIDDISANSYVAIHSMKRRRQSQRTDIARQLAVAVIENEPPVPMGVPLRVLELSLPFIACSIVEPGGTESGPVILDLRVMRLCRVRERFVRAIKAFAREPDASCGGEPCDSVHQAGEDIVEIQL